MNLLALDTAGKTAAVAVLRDDTLLYEAQCNNGLTHSETLLPMVEAALSATRPRPSDDLGVLAVGADGRGSFTGLRIGHGRRQGAGPARTGLPCAGVSTMAALAWGAFRADGAAVGRRSPTRGAGEVYWGAH